MLTAGVNTSRRHLSTDIIIHLEPMAPLTELQEKVLAIVIDRRKENPIRGVEIAAAVELKDRDSGKQGADLREVVNALRTKGYPVCADTKGYYWPGSESELQEYIESFAGRIASQEQALEGMRAGFDKVGKDPLQVLEEAPKPTVHKI